ncbi:hypothetical protein BH09MYX1_BH09MYX1_55310 [soil metagenome]
MSRRALGIAALAFAGALTAVAACGDTPTETVIASCIPGRSLSCAGPSGCKGLQVCRSDGTFDECSCPDATVPADGDVPDGDDHIDGGRRDGALFRDAPVDAPIDAPIDVVDDEAAADVAVDVFVPPAGWGIAFGTGPSGNAVAVAVDASKNVVVASNGSAASLTKLAPNGVVTWQKWFADLSDVAVDPNDGSIVVIGGADPNTDFGGGVVSAGGVFAAKYTASGVYQWVFGPFGTAPSFRQVAVRSNGNVVIVGELDQTVNLGSGVLTQAGYGDALLVELTPAGAIARTKVWGDAGHQELGSVAFDASGNVVVGGRAESSIDFGGGPITGPPANSGSHNTFFVKLDANDAFLGQRATGSNAQDYLSLYGTDSAGRMLVGGRLASKMNFGVGDLLPVTTADIVIAALDTSLTQVWAKQFGQQAGSFISSLASNPAGGFTAVGYSNPPLSFGLGGLPPANFPFVVRFDANGTPLANFALSGAVAVPTDIAFLTGSDFVFTGQCGLGQVGFPWGSMKCYGNSSGYVARVTP